ncbi:MAG: DUF3261 domain-containing protein [Fibrobacter sp.]|jgi:hypothetical protein|nr:DUF3261 domain-containing protein [Fibrobacter sp.]
MAIRHYFFWSLIAVGIVWGMFGCRSVSQLRVNEHPVYLTDEHFFSLLPPSEIETPFEGAQHLQGKYGDSEFEMEAWIKASDSLISIHVFNALGGTFAEIFYTEDSLTFSSRILDTEKQRPEYVIADFQLCYYRAGALKKNLETAGFIFEVHREGNTETRLLKSGEKTVITIRKTPGELYYKNLWRGYEYRILSEVRE